MSVMEDREKELPKLRVITGGKTGGFDWLSPMSCGTIFLCGKRETGDVQQLQKLFHTEGGYVRLIDLDNPLAYPFWVNPLKYCIYINLLEVRKEGDD